MLVAILKIKNFKFCYLELLRRISSFSQNGDVALGAAQNVKRYHFAPESIPNDAFAQFQMDPEKLKILDVTIPGYPHRITASEVFWMPPGFQNSQNLPKTSEDVPKPPPQTLGQKMYTQLNPEQKRFVDRVLQLAFQPRQSKMVFVNGAGGTGKTFCYSTIFYLLKEKGKRVACVAHTGIAANLLPFGSTAHWTFSIPLEVKDGMTCRVAIGSPEAEKLKKINVIIWDEGSMTDRKIYNAVNTLFQSLYQNSLPFGGVTIVMGGDWRQILPIVDNVKGEEVLKFILKNSDLWKNVEKFELTQNERAVSDPEYARFVLKIGNGQNGKLIHMPEKFVERGSSMDLINWVFPNLEDVDTTKNSAVLTVTNETAIKINHVVMDKMKGEERVFYSEDTLNGNGMPVGPEVLASTPQGLPEHALRLKPGAQVMLLRNLAMRHGLCNGTRLTVESFWGDILRCSVNNKLPHSPKIVYLRKIPITTCGKDAELCNFTRLQYPIRLAYASTINKSQGQTLDRCGLLLNTPVFTHGQLYVAVSRVRRADCFRIWHFRRNSYEDSCGEGGILVRNVVYRDVLKE